MADLAEHTRRWRRAAGKRQSKAVARLSRTVAADAERMSDGHLARAREMRRRIVAGDRKLDRKLAKAVEKYRSRVEGQMRIERETVRRLARRDLWDKIIIASALPLFAAYGQPGRPFGDNNVVLMLSLLIWLVGEEVVESLFGSEKSSAYPLRDADAWTYLAPVANLLAGWWLLSDRQHERFVAERTVIPPDSFTATRNPLAAELVYRYEKSVRLSQYVAPEYSPDFETFTDVPAVATITSIRQAAGAAARIGPLRAKVHNGKLTITLEAVVQDRGGPAAPILDELEVAWMVDTQEPPTSTSPHRE